MTTYSIEKGRASYHALLDMLYVGYGNNSLDLCHSIEDTPSGITVMYDERGVFAGAEIPYFSKRSEGFPATVEVDSSSPFGLLIPSAKSF